MLAKSNNKRGNKEYPETKRLKEVDILRAIAIIFIICGHLVSYTSVQSLGPLHGLVLVTGLGFFTFLSGFSLHYRNGDIHTKREIVQFFKKRILRIYPLYIIALFLFGFCFQYLSIYHRLNLNIFDYLIHGVGGQILLSPGVVQPIFTLWFIGFIILCYVLYPILTSTKNNKVLLLIFSFTILFFLMLRLIFNIIDITFFWLFPTFVVGIIFSRTNYFEKKMNKSRNLMIILPIMLLSGITFVIYNQGLIWNNIFDSPPGITLNIFITTVFIISSISILFWVSKKCKSIFSKKAYIVVFSISLSSYVAYLFHRPFFALMTEFTLRLNMTPNIQTSFIIIAGLPILFLVSYFIQKFENKIKSFYYRSQKYK